MTISPLLRSAIESLEHGIEHFFLKYGKSNKFPLLHIDQAIELLLKALLQEIKGASIYTKKGKTVEYYECLNRLEKCGIKIPQRSFIEEIHDMRNSAQHVGHSFDEYTTGYHVKFAYDFIKNFMRREFGEELDDHISDEIKNYIKNIVIEPAKIKESQFKYIQDLIEGGKYPQSIISSWNAIEFLIKGYSDEKIGRSLDELIQNIKEKDKISKEAIQNLKEIEELKDAILFTDKEVKINKAKEVLEKSIDISKSKIVVVKVPEKIITKKQLTKDEEAEPVRLVDDTQPIETSQELLYANIKLYNSDNSYICNFDTGL